MCFVSDENSLTPPPLTATAAKCDGGGCPCEAGDGSHGALRDFVWRGGGGEEAV